MWHCDYVRQEFKKMSECCPACHDSKGAARITGEVGHRIKGAPLPIHICCRVLRCMDERGLLEKGEIS